MKSFPRILIALVLSFALFTSCKKENAPTQGQLIGARLKSDLSQAQIESVSIYNSANGNSDIWHNVAVNNDGTVTVWNTNGGSTYSLENLLNYEISGSNLYLYF